MSWTGGRPKATRDPTIPEVTSGENNSTLILGSELLLLFFFSFSHCHWELQQGQPRAGWLQGQRSHLKGVSISFQAC